MEKTLAEAVSEAEKDLLGIKTTQRTQNDSYQFYAYQSDNLWQSGSLGRTINIQFIPTQRPEKEVICRFYATSGTAVQYLAVVNVDPTDPLRATYYSQATAGLVDVPAFIQFEYIGCYTNCAGELIIS